jgi:AraC-like DNA-binding protein
VDAVLHGRPHGLSPRSAQYRFLRATGVAFQAFRQIARARRAAALLEQGMALGAIVHEVGYYDQPHLTRSLKRFLGHTPAHLARGETPHSP